MPPLLSVAAAITSGVQPFQFMDSIHAGNVLLGNRAFLHWVGQLHAANLEPDSEPSAAPGSQNLYPTPADTAPLQFGPKSRGKKKKEAPVAEAAPELQPEATPQAGAAPAPEPRETLPRSESAGASRPAAKKKKKKKSVVRAMEKPVEAQVKTELSRKEKDVFECCYYGHAGRLKRLLRYGKVDINMAVTDGTPLGYAVCYGHTAVARVLLSAADIDVNLACQGGHTPLYIALQQGHKEIVGMLLADHRINANLGLSDEFAPLHLAVERKDEKVIRLLLASPGINVNVRKPNGATPLLIAAQDNLPEVVDLLLKKGADANLRLLEGRSTPLILATMLNHLEVVRLLLQQPDIQVDLVTREGASALCIASQEGHEEFVRLLLEKGADPDISGDIGATPVHLAVVYRRPAILKRLLDAGADIDLQVLVVGEKFTAFEIALLMGRRDLADLLAEHKLNKPARTHRLERPSPEDEPVWSTPPTTPPPEWWTPPSTPPPGWFPASLSIPAAATPATPSFTDCGATTPVPIPDSPAAIEGQPPEIKPGQAQAPPPLVTAKDALINEVLEKLDNQTLDPAEGIWLMADVRAAANIDMLCVIYNRLAGMERERRRTRRQRRHRHDLIAAEADPVPPHTTSPRYVVGKRGNLDSDAAEVEIGKYLDPAYHRFISQAVNGMEFGRGKPTSGYPSLLHASAGIPGVGSCSVFYHIDTARNLVDIAGIGHHLDRNTYQLDYAAGELRGCRTIHLS